MKITLSLWLPRMIVAILLWLIVEEFVYGRLQLGPVPYVICKISTELSLYVMVVLMLAYRACLSHRPYRLTWFDILFGSFIAFALLSTLWNGGSIVSGMVNIRTLLRYVAVYYLIILSAWTPCELKIRKLFSLMTAIALIQTGIAMTQFLMGDEFITAYFSPPVVQSEVADIQVSVELEKKLGASIGTFGKPASMAYFLLLPAILALVNAGGTGKLSRGWLATYALLLIGIFLTYKRGALLLALMAPAVLVLLSRKKVFLQLATVIYSGGLAALVLLLSFYQIGDISSKEKQVEISPVESLMKLGTDEYWENTSSSSRGWFITEVGGDVLSTFNLLGFGADEDNARNLLARSNTQFAKLVSYSAFDDVSLVSALIYYGPLGLTMLVCAMVILFRQARRCCASPLEYERKLGLLLCTMLLMLPLAMLVERVMELRAFAFTFWSLAGLVMVVQQKNYRERASTLPGMATGRPG